MTTYVKGYFKKVEKMPTEDGRFKGISVPELPWLKQTVDKPALSLASPQQEDDLERLAKLAQQEDEE